MCLLLAFLAILGSCQVALTYDETDCANHGTDYAYDPITNICFVVFKNDTKYDWSGAQQRCLQNGGSLVEDLTWSKHFLLTKLLKKLNPSTYTWLGGKYEKGNWTWVDDKLMEDEVTDSGMPGDCGCFTNGVIQSCDCRQSNKFFCQGPKDLEYFHYVNNIMPYIQNMYRGEEHYYFLVRDMSDSWEDVRDWCHQHQMDLVTSVDFLSNISSSDLSSKDAVWIGLRRPGWYWETGAPVEGEDPKFFPIYKNSASCVAAVSTDEFPYYSWYDRPCDKLYDNVLCDMTTDFVPDPWDLGQEDQGNPEPEPPSTFGTAEKPDYLMIWLLVVIIVLFVLVMIMLVSVCRMRRRVSEGQPIAKADANVYEDPGKPGYGALK